MDSGESATSSAQRRYQIELYEEHLEEGAFVYEQRLALLTDPEVPWPELDDLEERLEAHLDALVIGQDVALEICRQRAIEGDPGELYTALCLFCRIGRKEMVQAVLDGFDKDDVDKARAVTDALAAELPPPWEAEFASLLANPNTPSALVSIVARCFGTRRAAVASQLQMALEHGPEAAKYDVVWALGQIAHRSMRALFVRLLKDDDRAVRAAAMRGLLRMQDLEAAKRLDEMVSDPFMHLLAGLGGRRPLANALGSEIQKGSAGSETMIAVGLLGDPAAVPVLISCLQDKRLAPSAAVALDLITGAGTTTEVFVPEEIDKDTLFDEELEKLEQGQPPVGPEGKPLGETRVEICTDHGYWSSWWQENEGAFNPSIRYRNGKRYSPSCLLKNIEDPDSPVQIRQLAYEELVIRYGLDVPFDATAWVSRQREAIGKIGRWISEQRARFQEGSWYFGGRFLG